MKLFLVRHAQSANNLTEQLQPGHRVIDPPLTELGQRQAQAVAAYLAQGYDVEDWVQNRYLADYQPQHGFGIQRLFASPMLRALQTAHAISQAVGLPIEVWPDIHENRGLFLGEDPHRQHPYSGLPRSAIAAQFPTAILPPEVTEDGWWRVPTFGLEDEALCVARALRVAQTLRYLAETETENPPIIALVTHGAFMIYLVKALLKSFPDLSNRYSHYNTGITRLDFAPEGICRVRYTNRIQHLPLEDCSW